MKILKVLGIIIVVLAIIILVGGMFLPKTYSVSRSTIINAPDSVIYKNIADFNEFLKWNPWAKMEPTAKTTISGPSAQPEHLYQWEGKETGSGQMKVKSVEPNKMVDIELKFIKPFESLADTKFAIAPEGTGNKVTWTMSGENNLISKWMCLFVSMDKMIGKDFEDGLKYLKEKSESDK
ncbi:polyketide cyclase [Pedobacter polaris]|uniref:Polyketide cyclase n=1 Tax=Pedobacter polaris TaxID=2571273 RepID=A0A4U1CI48_9SPHI|nr:SRPBCC family protein [Pedobacter polaris]TKC05640.1 polyketide cyclase [Pedobacter polaris]